MQLGWHQIVLESHESFSVLRAFQVRHTSSAVSCLPVAQHYGISVGVENKRAFILTQDLTGEPYICFAGLCSGLCGCDFLSEPQDWAQHGTRENSFKNQGKDSEGPTGCS